MLSVLAIRTYRHLFAAQVIALIGTGMMTVALGLLAFKIAGDKGDKGDGTKRPKDQIPAPIRALDGKKVSVQGFMIPIKLDKGATKEFLIPAVLLDLRRTLRIHRLHFLQLLRRQFMEMTNQVHQLPAVLVVLVARFAPGGHARQPNAVLDDEVQLAVGELLRV